MVRLSIVFILYVFCLFVGCSKTVFMVAGIAGTFAILLFIIGKAMKGMINLGTK